MTDVARILVVDDDPSALDLMDAALRRAGFAVTTAGDGDEALRRFRAYPFDMVMLDVDMPGKSGFEVCAALRAEAGELLPIVMVTGMDDIASVESAYHAGATDFIGKPINWGALGHRARYLLRSYRAFLDLRAAQASNTAVLRAIPDLVFELDAEGRYVAYHSRDSDLLAAPADTFLGRTVSEILPPDAAQACLEALRTAGATGLSTGRQFQMQLPHGTFWFELSVSRKESGHSAKPHFIVLSRDITERKEAERRILRLAFFDELTGLPNRQSFLDRVDREIARARHSSGRLAVLFMDLDGFKSINDTMGHGTGDLILRQAAERLRQAIRPSDVIARPAASADTELARLGGDEFTALVLDLTMPGDALVVANRILQSMRQPFATDRREVMLTTSVGIAVFPDDGADAATLLKHADTAMYQAKRAGRNSCELYSAALTRQAVQRMNLDTGLRRALARDEFRVVYQPQFDVARGRVLSVEALIRWQHPDLGLVSPLQFIPLAEENGFIVPIGAWVLQTACADAARWTRAGHRLRVAVNLSPLQLRDPHLLATVLGELAAAGLAPDQLELEVTEGALMEDSSAVLATLKQLRDAGVHLALDDFGTGYSSMSYLKRMPLDHLKLDGSFVKGLPGDAENAAIVRAILSLARNLGLRVTAEGVETAQQAEALEDLACGAMQGYYFGRPVPAGEIPALVTRLEGMTNPTLSLAAAEK